MDTTSRMKSLEKRELHIPDSLMHSISVSSDMQEELDTREATTTNQELDILETMVDYYIVLLASSEEGAVGVYVSPSSILGRKSTGGVVALTASDIITILNSYSDLLPTVDPHVVGQWWNNGGVVSISTG